MKLSEHFTLKEMIYSETANKHLISNNPNEKIVEQLKITCKNLEYVRTIWGKPMHILSGYRCEHLNSMVGGSRISQHMEGKAADVFMGGDAQEMFLQRLLDSKIRFDQIIFYPKRNFIHFSFNPPENRNQMLQSLMKNKYNKMTFV